MRKHNAFEDVRAVGSWVRVFSGVMAAVLVLCVGVSSYAYASEAVLPDTALYPVREVIEQVEVALAVTPVQKEKVEKKLEVRRVKEVEKLTELKRPVPAPLKKYVGAKAATTTKALLKKAQQDKKEEQKEQREQKREEAQTEIQDRLQARFRLPKQNNKESARIVVPTSSRQVLPREERVRRQSDRQTVLEQRRILIEKRLEERQKQREEARNHERDRMERKR